MLSEERVVSLVKELLDDYQNGAFQDLPNVPEKYTYEYLIAMFQAREALSDGIGLFRMFYHDAMACCTSYIRKKAARHEVIRVAFMSYSAAQWPAEKLYRDLEQDERFDPYIIVSPLTNRDVESSLKSYNDSLQWYQENGYRVYGGLTDRVLTWEELGGIPDIVVHLSSWYECIPREQQFLPLPWRCLNLYVPYAMMLGDNKDHTHSREWVFNKDIVNVMWRVYADSLSGKKGYETYSIIQGENAVFSGYLKMDELLQTVTLTEEDLRKIWKVPEQADIHSYKKVIVAPHFQMADPSSVMYSTFRDNYNYWIYLAEKYQDSITFIFKPHPNLRANVVGAGLFQSQEEYDKYLDRWNRLPNAKVVTEASYLDIFRSSDAMIMDSNSFLGEYLYVHKPLLFLTRKEQVFNELGAKLLEAHYKTSGRDYDRIERFLQEVVLSERDVMKKKREEIFKEYLDYYHLNHRYAHEMIYSELLSLVKDRKKNKKGK